MKFTFIKRLSIRKKLIALLAVVVLVPMTSVMVTTDYFLRQQMHDEEIKFLSSTLEIARSEMAERRSDISKSCICLTRDRDAQRYLATGNYASLVPKLRLIQHNFTKVDYAIIIDAERHVLANVSKDAIFNPQSILGRLSYEAMRTRHPVTSTEVIPLQDLYRNGSPEYQRFSVLLTDGISGKGEYLKNALIETTIVPIVSLAENQEILGAVILVGIANSDYYFPQYIESRATEGFLALTVDGVIVATKSTKGEEKDYLVGSISNSRRRLKQIDRYSYGTASINNLSYIVADEPITNHDGSIIGYISIGVPESRYRMLVQDNRRLIFVAIALCLLLGLPLGQLLSRAISNPIISVSRTARAASRKYFGTDSTVETDVEDEAVILYNSFNDFINNLKENEAVKARYIKQLEAEHSLQKELTAKLQAANETLESKVAERTEHLQTLVADLRKLDMAKSQFLANISHELRTPLSVIINACEILEQQYFGPLTAKQAKYVASSRECSEHLLLLINNLLDLSKLSAGKMTLTKEWVYLKDLVGTTIENVRSLDKTKELEIRFRVEPEDFTIYADPQRLKQIFYNLLSNAVKFTPSGGIITINIYRRLDKMEAIVRDNGIGIATQDQERIFHEFEQGDNTSSKRYEGTGLGLPIVKQLIELHGGEIFLSSKEGQGTEIIFTLPIGNEVTRH